MRKSGVLKEKGARRGAERTCCDRGRVKKRSEKSRRVCEVQKERERVETEEECEKETPSEPKEKEIGVCVLVFRRIRATENTCRRRTRADGEHVLTGHERRQRPAVGQRGKGSRDSLLFFFINLGIVSVSVMGGLVR